MESLRLRCKTSTGTHQLKSKLFANSTLAELKEAIKIVSGVEPCKQKIMTGYPPKQLDLSNNSLTLSDAHVRNGDTFTVVNTESRTHKQEAKLLEPVMKRKEVPADNSCLFYSVFFALNGYLTEANYSEAKHFRSKIANVVRSNPEKYSEAFLGRTTDEYSVWIQCDTSWGGGIELSILSEIYQVEIAAIDIQTQRVDNYGQDENYATRIFLLYDGIHYDPMFMDPQTSKLPHQTIFPKNDDLVLIQALKVAEEAHNARQFTDTANFTLRCLTCNKCLNGQTAAQAHAKETGHGNFGEIS
uniref:Ubiquitin thioesterase OTU n=1 Tax=Phallusia mammillata TaxID=59560 RepID=A0A6F9DWN6_9ASCI|nr:ubiquitin thioesterase OTU1-like [Phallusia mammillata]